MYSALIRSTTEYSSTIFKIANQKSLKIIDMSLNTSILILEEDFRSSSIKSQRYLGINYLLIANRPSQNSKNKIPKYFSVDNAHKHKPRFFRIQNKTQFQIFIEICYIIH